MVDQNENNEAAGDEKAPAKKRGRMGLVLVAVLVLSNAGLATLLLTGGIGGGGAGDGTGQTAEAEEDDEDAPEVIDELGPIVELEPFVLNLDEPGRPRYLRIAISLEVPNPDAQSALEAHIMVLRDRFISFLSSQQADELRTPDDKERLREDLVVIARQVVSDRSIRSLYFTEFLIQ